VSYEASDGNSCCEREAIAEYPEDQDVPQLAQSQKAFSPKGAFFRSPTENQDTERTKRDHPNGQPNKRDGDSAENGDEVFPHNRILP